MKPDRSPSVYPAQGGSGISLRDYFAAAALTGGLAKSSDYPVTISATVDTAYEIADAMLAKREKKP